MNEQQALDLMRRRKRDYQLALNQPPVQAMLADLARFCRAVRMTEEDIRDPTKLAILVGRQQVWERIQHYLNLSVDELYAIYTGRTIYVDEDSDVAA